MLAGLMHGMGRVYILTRAVKHPDLFNDPGTYHQIVRDWNAQVAKAVLESWEISPDIIDAVEQYEILDRAGSGEVDLTDVLTIANVLVSFHTDLPAMEMRLKETAAAVRLGVTAEAINKVLQETGRRAVQPAYGAGRLNRRRPRPGGAENPRSRRVLHAGKRPDQPSLDTLRPRPGKSAPPRRSWAGGKVAQLVRARHS